MDLENVIVMTFIVNSFIFYNTSMYVVDHNEICDK